MFSVLVIRLRSLRLLRVSGIVMRLRMFLLLITFLKASHSFRNRLLVICKNAYSLSPLRRGLAIDSTVDIFTFYVPHRHVYGEQWIKFMKDGVNATPLPTVNTTG